MAESGKRTRSSVFNFSAGPGVIADEVLKEAQEDLMNWKGGNPAVKAAAKCYTGVHSVERLYPSHRLCFALQAPA